LTPEESPTTRAGAGPPPSTRAIVLRFGETMTHAQIAVLCRRLRASLENSEAELAVCDVGALVDPDAVAVEALVRLQLTARRCGRRVCLLHAKKDLLDLLALSGLDEVVPCATVSIPLQSAPEGD